MVNISENLEVLEGVKDDIKTAIENKGIVINDTTPFVDYATKINEISIGTGDYQDGYEQGKLDQKALLENRTFRRNGTYSRPDGYGTVVVDVPSGGTGDYDTGFEDGVAAQKAKLTNITITNNGTYTSEDGYSTVVVDVVDENGNYQDGYNTGIEEGKITGYNSGYTAGETAQKSKLTGITITENGTYLKDDGYNEVIVNVPQTGGTTGSLALVDGTKFKGSTFTEIPDYYDFSNITDGTEMFKDCGNLQTLPLISTSKFNSMAYMFQGCTNLLTIPLLITSNVVSMVGMFRNCTNLQTIPEIDLSNVEGLNSMFYNCFSLNSLPSFNAINLFDNGMVFGGYDTEGINTLTDVGGWINLKYNWDDSFGLKLCPNLTYQSCINILNGLYDFTGNGEVPTSYEGKLKVHQNFLDTVGDEISIGINKNWTIST